MAAVSYIINIPRDAKPSKYIKEAIDNNNFKRRRCTAPQDGCHVSYDDEGNATVVMGSNLVDKHRGNAKDMFSTLIRQFN